MKNDHDSLLHSSAVLRVMRFLIYLAIVSAAAAYSPLAIAQDAQFPAGVSLAAREEPGSSSQQPSKGILDLDNTFWRLKQIQGSTANVSDAVVRILILTPDGANGTITFSTPSYFIAFPFVYKSTGLETSSAYSHGGNVDNAKFSQDQQTGRIFESTLQSTRCYELSGGVLTLMDRERHSLIVLSAVQQEGIENRRWRIAKYRGHGDNSTRKDKLIEAKEPADVTFMNGRIYGSPGCGGWVGIYTISGNNLTTDVSTILAGLCSSKQLVQRYWVEKDMKGDIQSENSDKDILLSDRNRKPMILLVPF